MRFRLKIIESRAVFMKKDNKSKLKRREDRFGYLFIAPFVIGFIFIYADLIFSSVSYSFSELVFKGKSFESNFIGLKNYKEVLKVNAEFMPALAEALEYMLTMVPVVLIFSLFIATLLNRKMPGRTIFRSIFFIPVILMTGIVTKTDSNLLVQSVVSSTNELGASAGMSSGLNLADISTALQGMSIGTGAIDFIITFIDDIYSVVNNSGVQIILLLASLQSISPSVYEAAAIEGATAWESFWKITLPMVSPVVFVCAIYTVIDLLSASTNNIMELIEKTTENTGYGIASAMAWIFFSVIAVILAIVVLIGRKAAFKQ